MSQYYTSGEFAKKAHVSIRTIRYYDQKNLLKPAAHTKSGARLYTDEDFAKYLPEYKNLDELKDHYRRGGLGDVVIKKFLNNVLQDTLRPIREKRHELENNIEYVYDVLKGGTEVARAKAREVLARVKRNMKIDYFESDEFKQEIVAKYTEKW